MEFMEQIDQLVIHYQKDWSVNKIHDDEKLQHKKYDIDFAQLANNVQQNIDREKTILAQEYKQAIFNEMDKVRNAR